MDHLTELAARMIDFNQGEPGLSHHLLKVHAFARAIGVLEGLDAQTLETLEMAALVHDIGIKWCMNRHGHCTGKMQEEAGPPLARALLEDLGVPAGRIERVCYLVSRHHTYTDIEGMDYRILLEADFLVNLHENDATQKARQAAYENIFRTQAGKRFFRDLYA